MGMTSLEDWPLFTWSLGWTMSGADVAAHDLGGSVGDDLVGVHISRSAGAGLEDVEDEMGIKFAVDDLLGGLDDGVFLVGVPVGPGRS